MNNKGNLLIIVIVIIIILIACLFFIRVGFDSFPSDNPSLICENGTLKQVTSNDLFSIADSSSSMTNLVLMADASQCFLRANADTSATAQTVCVNNQPTVICRIPLYKAIFMGKIIFLQNSNNPPTNQNNKSPTTDYVSMCEKGCGGNLTISPLLNAEYTLVDYNNPKMPQVKHLLNCGCQNGQTIAISLP